MKKMVLIILTFLSLSVFASKGDKQCDEIKLCNEFWKPLIKRAKESYDELQNEWNAMPSWDQKSNGEVFEAACRMQRLQRLREKARNYCLINGLEKSQEQFEKAL